MEWQICSVNPPGLVLASEQIGEIQEAGWSRAQILSSLEGESSRARVAEGRAEHHETAAIEIQGFVLARRIADVLEIDLVGVRRSMRRRGLARGLLEALIGDETRSGLAQARLELASANEAARGLYEGLGFVVVGRRTRYYPDGDDALLLSRPNSSS